MNAPFPPKPAPPTPLLPRRALTRRPAFSLIELLIVIVIIALLLAILIPALSQARRSARAAVCQSNLKQFGTAAGTYTIDFKGYVYMFSWTPQYIPTQYQDLIPPGGVFGNHAHAIQAAEIIRRNSQWEPDFPSIGLWCPAIEYSHLVLLDYMSTQFPVATAACPEDRPLKLWQSDVPAFNRGDFGVDQPAFEGFERNLMRAKPYSSSYETPPATYDRTTRLLSRMRQSNATHYIYGVDSSTKFGPARFDDITFPSLKVHLYDTHQRHRGKPLFFAHENAVQPVLQFDSSVVERKTRDSGRGWQAHNPTGGPTLITYAPYRYEPPTSNGQPTETFFGHYRWTRGGLKGVDFGPEVTRVR